MWRASIIADTRNSSGPKIIIFSVIIKNFLLFYLNLCLPGDYQHHEARTSMQGLRVANSMLLTLHGAVLCSADHR